MKSRTRRTTGWLYPAGAYLVVVALLTALYLQPEQIFTWITVSVCSVILIAGLYYSHQGRIHKDTYLEYLLVLVATIIVLFGAVHHN